MLTILIIIIIIGLHYNGVAFLGFDKVSEFLDKNNYSTKEGEEIYRVKIISNGIKKENTVQYLVKIDNKKFYLYLKNSIKNIDNLEYGDQLEVKGKYEEPNSQRNYKGFDYSLYLKTKKIYGSIYSDNAKIIPNKTKNIVENYNRFICGIQKKIFDRLYNNLNDKQFPVGLRTTNGKYQLSQ